MHRANDPSIPQLSIPVTVPYKYHCAAYLTTNNKRQATADFYFIVFSYLLRVGEYTTLRK